MSAYVRLSGVERDHAILASKGIPPFFHQWRYSGWNKTQLLLSIRALGGHNLRDNTKRNLFHRLHQLRRATPPLSKREISVVRKSRRKGKISSRSTVRAASRLGRLILTKPKKKDSVSGNVSQHASPFPSTTRPSQVTQECEVCADEIAPELRVTQAITQDCKHSMQTAICKTCIEHHVRVQIVINGWDRISCPVLECREIFKYNDLHNVAAAEDFERYDIHLFEKAMEQETSGCYRRCAQPDCAGGGWCDPKTESFMTCPACAQRTCVECNVIWHSEKTCAEHKEEIRIQKEKEDAENAAARDAAEAKSAKYVEKKSKVCPNLACGYRIQKNGGCDHMTCRQCSHQFCWLCLADYHAIRRKGNAAHMPDCAHHTTQIARLQAIGRLDFERNLQARGNEYRRRVGRG